jgi:endonuclease/exonuclease/phosphatase family metal-dependent hydrolase
MQMSRSTQPPIQVPVTLVTYNIRRCLGTDRRLSPERIAEVMADCDADIVALQEIDVRPPYAVLGGLNSRPHGTVYRSFAARPSDANLAGTQSRRPMLRVGHIFVSGDIEVTSAKVVRSPLTRVASDHLPLIAQLRISAEGDKAGLVDSHER